MTEQTSIEKFPAGVLRFNDGIVEVIEVRHHPSADREEISQAICDAMYGHDAEDAYPALADAVSAQVIAASTDLENADAIVDELAAKVKSLVRQNWAFIKDQLAEDWE